MYEHAKNKYMEVKKEYSDIDNRIVETFLKEMPEEAIMFFDKILYGCHIASCEFYNSAVELLEWVNEKGEGEKFTVNEIVKTVNFDFEEKEYTKYDFAYIANMLYSDFCNIFTDITYYTKMAKNYLEDPDYMGNASERAYHNAKKRIKYYKNEE